MTSSSERVLDITPAAREYLAGRILPRDMVRDAFSQLGAMCTGITARSEGYEEYLELERDIFRVRDRLVGQIDTARIPAKQEVNYIVHRMLECEPGNRFFYDVIIPFYRPYITHIAPYNISIDASEELVEQMLFGNHSSDAREDEGPEDYNFNGSLLGCIIAFRGDSSFHTFLQSTMRFKTATWLQKISRAPIAMASLNGRAEEAVSFAEKLTSDATPRPDGLAAQHDAEIAAGEAWKESISRLTPQRRKLLTLLVQEKDDDEIADILDMPAATVRSNKFYLRQLLRGIVAEFRQRGIDADNMTMLHGLVATIGNGHDSATAKR